MPTKKEIFQQVMQRGAGSLTPEQRAWFEGRDSKFGRVTNAFREGTQKGILTGNPYAALGYGAYGAYQELGNKDPYGQKAGGPAGGPGGQPLIHPGVEGAINARANLANQLGNRAYSPFRQQQQQYIDSLRADAEGRGLAQEMVRRQVSEQAQSGIQNQLAQSASARGGYNPLAARTAAVNSALISGRAGQAASMGGIQAQLGARGQLQGALAGARGQDQSFADLTQRGQLQALSQQNQLFNIYGGGAQHGATLNNQILLEQMRQKFGSRKDPSDMDKAMAFGTGLIETYAKNRAAGSDSDFNIGGTDSQDGSFRPTPNYGQGIRTGTVYG